MQVFSPLMSRSNSRLVRVLALVLPMVVLLTGLLTQRASAENTFVITDGENVTVYTGDVADPAEVLNQAGVELRDDDYFTHVESADGVSQITVQRSQVVTVDNCGAVTQVLSYGERVGDLLDRQGIAHTEQYVLNVGLEEQTYDGMQIRIDWVLTQEQTFTRELPYQVIYRDDTKLEVGTELVAQPGSNGQALVKSLVTYSNGVEVSREDLSAQVIQEPVHEIRVRGTGENLEEVKYPIIGDGYIILQTGEVLTFTHAETYMGTGYTSWCEDVGDTTATGTFARYGAVAVDPDQIPYGTRMYIVSADGVYDYGISTAEDCGGGVRGKHIDLFFDTVPQCFEFGRRDIIVYFLGEADWRGPQHRR